MNGTMDSKQPLLSKTELELQKKLVVRMSCCLMSWMFGVVFIIVSLNSRILTIKISGWADAGMGLTGLLLGAGLIWVGFLLERSCKSVDRQINQVRLKQSSRGRSS